ncbi:hypothetical protein HNP86_001887 [Methanococcus maripaludis]|uniref:ATPase AAA-type core domain-containing protein n=1 Tax=Methanococcus maripaludis TaxID=39152 RepID=A0A7J9NVM3_METMI|nr:MoxR family ATPase [Methanococcus maripaludis]MBA2851728.1 hypothetical protein [Methanococcus maripaludis]
MMVSRTEAVTLLDVIKETNEHHVSNNDNEACKVPYISGPPGIGKSALVRNYGKTLDLPYNRISLTSLEYYELKGLLYPNTDKTVDILPLNIFPPQRCFLFIDELNAADVTIQKVLLDLFHERRINSFSLDPNTFIVSAGNRPDDVPEMCDLIKPLADRCREIRLTNTLEDALLYLKTISHTMYVAMIANKDVLRRILNNGDPVTFRNFTYTSYIVNQYATTQNNRYKVTLDWYLGKELTDVILTASCKRECISSMSTVEKICTLYEMVVNNNAYSDEELKTARGYLNDYEFLTVGLYCKANGTIDKLHEFNEKVI